MVDIENEKIIEWWNQDTNRKEWWNFWTGTNTKINNSNTENSNAEEEGKEKGEDILSLNFEENENVYWKSSFEVWFLQSTCLHEH